MGRRFVQADQTRRQVKNATVMDPFAAAAIRLLIFTGARLREILDLKWDHVDFERGTLFLRIQKPARKRLSLIRLRSTSSTT